MFYSFGTETDASPKVDAEMFQNNRTNVDHIMKQAEGGRINKLWTLLDSQSTVDLFCNDRMLTKVHAVKTHLKVYSTGGMAMINLIGFLPGFGWYHTHP